MARYKRCGRVLEVYIFLTIWMLAKGDFPELSGEVFNAVRVICQIKKWGFKKCLRLLVKGRL